MFLSWPQVDLNFDFFFKLALLCTFAPFVYELHSELQKEQVSIHCREALHCSPCSRIFMKWRVHRESSQVQALISFQNNGLIWFSWVSSSWSLSRQYSWSFSALQAMLRTSILLNTVKSEISSFELSELLFSKRTQLFLHNSFTKPHTGMK